MVVKTFRGLLTDGEQERIRLSTIQGKVGYRIVKFQLFPAQFGVQDQEATVAIWKTFQSTIVNELNFTDANLLAGACMSTDNSENNPLNTNVIFDQEIINQDIYVTHLDAHADNTPCNYYIELEVIPLSEQGAEYTTIKDLRSS
jgi:hypothetical protein